MRDSAKFKKIIDLYIQGLSYEKIAKATWTSRGTVSRAIKQYKNHGFATPSENQHDDNGKAQPRRLWLIERICYYLKKLANLNPFRSK